MQPNIHRLTRLLITGMVLAGFTFVGGLLIPASTSGARVSVPRPPTNQSPDTRSILASRRLANTVWPWACDRQPRELSASTPEAERGADKQMDDEVLYSVADACVVQGFPFFNYGDLEYMLAGYDGYFDVPGEVVRSMVQFSIADLPSGIEITKATLRLYLVVSWDSPGTSRTIRTYQATSAWSEGNVTWYSQPSRGEEYGSALVPYAVDLWVEFDVTDLVRAWFEGTYSNHGILVRGPEASGDDASFRGFGTREFSYAPELVIVYTFSNDPPYQPDSPSPADGATGVSTETELSWTGGDPNPSDIVLYDVYLEADNATPGILVCEKAATPACDPGTLDFSTQYFWYVVATDEHDAYTTSDTWDFTTGQRDYTLDVSIIGQGTVTQEPEQDLYHYGDVVTLTATANPGWTFAGWSGDVESTDNPLALSIVGNTAITATFSQDEYVLDISIVGQGEVEIDPDQASYVYSDVVTLTAAADPGWTFTAWTGDVDSIDNPLAVIVEGDTGITATFTQDEYTLDVTVTGEGDVEVAPEQDAYVYGDVVTLTAIADLGWTFQGWSGDVASTTNPLSLTMDSDKSVTATFELKTYVITPTVGAGGVITPSSPQTVNHGDDITFTIAANTGYHTVDVAVDGISQGAISSYTFSNVTANHTISGKFALNVPPEITSADHTTFVVGEAEAFTVTATGNPTPTLALTGTLPGGVTFTENGDGTATLSGTPAIGSGGVYPLTIGASNGVAPDATQAFALTVIKKVYLPLVLANQ